MASNFPTSLDDLIGNQSYVDGTTVLEAVHLNNIQDAIDNLQDKVGIDSSAVATSHDYLLTNIRLKYDGTQVYNTTLPNPHAWTDIDLSSYLGSNRALAIIKIKVAGGADLVFRPKGVTEMVGKAVAAFREGGITGISLDGGNVGWILCPTDTSGVLQFRTSYDGQGVDCDMWLEYYLKVV